MDEIVAVFTFIWSLLQTLWFGLTTMLSGMMELVNSVFSSGLF